MLGAGEKPGVSARDILILHNFSHMRSNKSDILVSARVASAGGWSTARGASPC